MNSILDLEACNISGWFKIFIYILLAIICLFLLPIVPFVLISYHSFYGKYGIIPVIKKFNKKL